MRKSVLLIAFLATPLLGIASHIVGGEFELIHVKDFKYRLNMVLYFDENFGDQGAKDPNVTVRIFRKRNNTFVTSYILPRDTTSLVEYTQPNCSSGELITSRIFYSLEITLSELIFNEPEGYYVAWERCCRNYSISNIFSLNPNSVATGWAGQTFYMEFPPVVKNGQRFIDSTPRLFPPLSDYGCPYRPYYADFRGTDDDGDSLVYSLVTPLNTKTNEAAPVTRPGPYPDVTWRPGFGLNNIMNGSPDLRISTNGLLTVTHGGSQGLFVFAVKVEEFRNGVKIGETRRDFQMLVLDQCERAIAPQILGKKLTDPTFTYDEVMTATFAYPIPDADRCVKVKVYDEDSELHYDGIEHVRLKAVPLNFDADLSDIVPTISTATLTGGSTVEFMICFPFCPYFVNGFPEIGIIAMDDACSLPLQDTLKIVLQVEPPPNSRPVITSPAPVTATLDEGESRTWPFNVTDADGDSLTITMFIPGRTFESVGVSYTPINHIPGTVNAELTWDAFCEVYDFNNNHFKVNLQVEDYDECQLEDPVKTFYDLTVNLDDFHPPTIDTDLTSNPAERVVKGITRRIHEEFSFIVTANDPDVGDTLKLVANGNGYLFSNYGMTYTQFSTEGFAPLSGTFHWKISCTSINLEEVDSLAMTFIVYDYKNRCRLRKSDTLEVAFKVLPPLNSPPALTILNKNPEVLLQNNTISAVRGESIDLEFTGLDLDLIPQKDSLKIELVSADGNVVPHGYTFTPAEGPSPISATLTWVPDCSIFEGEVYENNYTFKLLITDDRCIVPKKDSVMLQVNVKDIEALQTEFVPPNFFSPNGDNVNDYYAMEFIDPVTQELVNGLPPDNCYSRFEGIKIYNRWGKQVFESADRNFQWRPQGESPGVYYYVVKFTRREYHGSITMRY